MEINKKLEMYQENLEELVKKRTGELEVANKGLESQAIELAVAKKQAEEANKAKSSFLGGSIEGVGTGQVVPVEWERVYGHRDRELASR